MPLGCYAVKIPGDAVQSSTTLFRHHCLQTKYGIFVPESDYNRKIVKIHSFKVSILDSSAKVLNW